MKNALEQPNEISLNRLRQKMLADTSCFLSLQLVKEKAADHKAAETEVQEQASRPDAGKTSLSGPYLVLLAGKFVDVLFVIFGLE